MADAAGPPDALRQAAACMERGDYGQVLRLLQPLAELHGPTTPLGGRLRLQMATALMGQGDTERAAGLCRGLAACRDSVLRGQARDLLLVLEAPALRRPAEWSLTLPPLPAVEPLQGRGQGWRRPSTDGPPPPPPPPVGPTRPPLGFAALAALVLLLLTLALSGCMQVRSELRFAGPGRLQIAHGLVSTSGRGTPWQQRLVQALRRQGYHGGDGRRGGGDGEAWLQGPVLPAEQALAALARDLELAAELADLPLPPPQLLRSARNWLVGEWQQLDITLDLRPLQGAEGVDLGLRLHPLGPRAVRRAEPRPAEAEPRARKRTGASAGPSLLWPLQPGALNRLQLQTWRWSPLGVGGGVIALALGLVLGLQRLRLALGFGLPELPA
ncbi:MAG: DUF3153 domain-containing protein [Cyanobacteriota bacterium]|nr:DUF3153 domain-containing protein [Cyanobacteriota bacterium]